METLRPSTGIEVVSLVKREKIRLQAKNDRLKQMRAALPVLTKNEIRKIRLPYYKAILCELEEEGYSSSALFLRQLFDYDKNLREQFGLLMAVSTGPFLVDCRNELDIVTNGLKAAELAHCTGNTETEYNELLKLGIMFGLGGQNRWWWLGEQFFIHAVSCTSDSKDGGRKTAVGRYLFGKFLLENHVQRAKAELLISRQLSVGKFWTTKLEFQGKPDTKQDTIFVGSCKLLYLCLLSEAKVLMKSDPQKAANICEIARKRATDACDLAGESEAMMTQGLCELAAGDAFSALNLFLKVLKFQKNRGSEKEICEAKIHIALAYLKMGKYRETLKHLEELLSFAQVKQLDYYIGQALRFLGEYYLNVGIPSAATPLLTKALEQFHKIEDIANREQARNLAAISAGQELMSKYEKLILNCGASGAKGHKHVLQLVHWKEHRELFWKEEERQEEEEAEDTSASKTSTMSYSSLQTSSEELNLNSDTQRGEVEFESEIGNKPENMFK